MGSRGLLFAVRNDSWLRGLGIYGRPFSHGLDIVAKVMLGVVQGVGLLARSVLCVVFTKCAEIKLHLGRSSL